MVKNNKKLLEENEKIKKIIESKEQKEKEFQAKLENLPFLQQKLRALEAILKRKKNGKMPSFDKMEDQSYTMKLLESKKKDDSEVF